MIDKTMPTDVLIGMATCMRPQMLAQALESLACQEWAGFSLRLVVVDNDPERSGQEVFHAFRERFPFPSSYLAEPVRGITHARNRVLELALACKARYVAFMDDDEVADRHWIAELHSAVLEQGVDGAQGAVFFDLPADAPDWAAHEYAAKNAKQIDATGGGKAMATNNVIFSSRLLTQMGLRFDHRFALTGGEDTDFFLRARERGARFITANRAVLHETMPRSRLTLGWHCRRYFRSGSTSMFIARVHQGRIRPLSRLPKAALRLAFGLLLLPLGLFSRQILFNSLRKISLSLGTFFGSFGGTYQEYRRIYGE